MKPFKKLAIRKRKTIKKDKETKNGDKKKLNKEDKDKLYEIFVANNNSGNQRDNRYNAQMKTNSSAKAFSGTSSLIRAKSPLRNVNDDEKYI